MLFRAVRSLDLLADTDYSLGFRVHSEVSNVFRGIRRFSQIRRIILNSILEVPIIRLRIC